MSKRLDQYTAWHGLNKALQQVDKRESSKIMAITCHGSPQQPYIHAILGVRNQELYTDLEVSITFNSQPPAT
jgi:hypothetical protein